MSQGVGAERFRRGRQGLNIAFSLFAGFLDWSIWGNLDGDP
jgi:hypothetical protein